VALGLISGLYALIYAPMRLVDYALLMALLVGLFVSAVASFAGIARVIYFTRRIVSGGRQQESEA
jgi:inner membrane protein involved in colicin E2 resistance